MADKHGPDENGEVLHRLRHSASHVMAQAVLQLYPDARLAIGPSRSKMVSTMTLIWAWTALAARAVSPSKTCRRSSVACAGYRSASAHSSTKK